MRVSSPTFGVDSAALQDRARENAPLAEEAQTSAYVLRHTLRRTKWIGNMMRRNLRDSHKITLVCQESFRDGLGISKAKFKEDKSVTF